MNALELIKQGLKSGDLDKISKGYQMMTGEKIEPSKISEGNLDKLKAVFSDLQGSSTPPQIQENPPPEPSPSAATDGLEETYIEEEVSDELIETLFSDGEQVVSDMEVVGNEGLTFPANPNVKTTIVLPGKPTSQKSPLLLIGGEQLVTDEGEQQRVGGGKCSRVPFDTKKKRVNKFRDNLAIASKDLVFDKKVRSENSHEAHTYIEKRPPDTGVVVKCKGCERKFRISSKDAPIRYDQDDEMNYECNSCVLKKGRRS